MGVERMSVDEARKYMEEGHFKKGSMYPKILASILYLESGGKEVLITSPEKVQEALEGKAGTWIYPQ
jgi:carbamate kinase